MSSYVYSFRGISVIFAFQAIEGFADDAEAVVVTYRDDQSTTMAMAGGDTLTNLKQDYSAEIIIRLHQRSPSNKIFQRWAIGYRTGTVIPNPLFIRDSASGETMTTATAFVEREAPWRLGSESKTREWKLIAPKGLSLQTGSNQPLV